MKIRTNYRWVIKIIIISIAASIVFTFASTEVIGQAGYVVVFSVLAVFIALGIIFDMIGVAVTAAVEAPFHSMAAHHERGAKEALRLIKNADKVSSFCNDVVGDVSGIISGSTAALIAGRFVQSGGDGFLIGSLLISGAVTGITIGGKAACKSIAINNSTAIALKAGKLINMLRIKKVST